MINFFLKCNLTIVRAHNFEHAWTSNIFSSGFNDLETNLHFSGMFDSKPMLVGKRESDTFFLIRYSYDSSG